MTMMGPHFWEAACTLDGSDAGHGEADQRLLVALASNSEQWVSKCPPKAAPGNLLEMQILSLPRPFDEALGWVPQSGFKKPSK